MDDELELEPRDSRVDPALADIWIDQHGQVKMLTAVNEYHTNFYVPNPEYPIDIADPNTLKYFKQATAGDLPASAVPIYLLEKAIECLVKKGGMRGQFEAAQITRYLPKKVKNGKK